MSQHVKSLVRRVRSDRRGAVAIIMAIGIVVLIGFSAIVVDVGYVLYAHRVLQATTDAAALAGGRAFVTGGDPSCKNAQSPIICTAVLYSGVAGKWNDHDTHLGITMASNYPKLKCFQTLVNATPSVPCTPMSDANGNSVNANGIVVQQQLTVPTFFARVWGEDSVPMTATATAGPVGGPGQSADVWAIVDATNSMKNTDSSCSGNTREACALVGLQQLLVDAPAAGVSIGVMTFPELTSGQAQDYSNCSGTKPTPVVYGTSETSPYQIVGLTAGTGNSGYQTSNGKLNTSSSVVKAAGGDPGCAGIPSNPAGGEGTYYALAINAAQAAFPADGLQHIIVLLSDGDATAESGQFTAALASDATNECHAAITAATTAKNAGTIMVTIAYGAAGVSSAATPASSSCSTDSPAISGCWTMEQMATVGSGSSTSPQWFYSDVNGGSSNGNGNTCSSGANSVTSLSGIFRDIAAKLTSARLLPNNTM